MSIGSRIKERREQLGMTQRQLADKLGVTKSAICNYENGTSKPKEDVLLNVFKVLSVDPNYIYQDSVDVTEVSKKDVIMKNIRLFLYYLSDEDLTNLYDYLEFLKWRTAKRKE